MLTTLVSAAVTLYRLPLDTFYGISYRLVILYVRLVLLPDDHLVSLSGIDRQPWSESRGDVDAARGSGSGNADTVIHSYRR